MRFVTLAACLALAMGSTAAFAQSAAPDAAGAHYSTSTTDIGTLLDDPAAKAIVFKTLPQLGKDDKIEQARSMTLKAIQQYAPDVVTDSALAQIDAEFSALPAKK
jgi:para-nitrobenzyl esterase